MIGVGHEVHRQRRCLDQPPQGAIGQRHCGAAEQCKHCFDHCRRRDDLAAFPAADGGLRDPDPVGEGTLLDATEAPQPAQARGEIR